MALATILMGGYLKKISKIKPIGYHYNRGFLMSFEYRNKVYNHVSISSLKGNYLYLRDGSAGYYDKEEFLKYLSDKDYTIYDIKKHKLDLDELEDGEIKDTVLIRLIKIVKPYTNVFKLTDVTWEYKGGDVVDVGDFMKILIPSNADRDDKDVDLNGVAKNFYLQRALSLDGPNYTDDNLKEKTANLIAYIALLINQIEKTVFPFLNTDNALEGYIEKQRVEWAGPHSFQNFKYEDFLKYSVDLNNFYKAAYANQVAISKAKIDNKLYWLAYFLSANALITLPVESKIDILKKIASGAILEYSILIEAVRMSSAVGHSLFKPVINNEQLVLKIIKSVSLSNNQADDFLNGLISTQDALNKTTLFETLYKKVDDFLGSDNLSEMVNELYKIWFKSAYNPYLPDGTLKDNFLNEQQYQNKPIYLGYEAEDFLFFFEKTNYDFNFKANNITVVEPVITGAEEQATMQDELIGTYGIYQTLAIKNTRTNTGEVNFVNIIGQENNVALPIFYLKFIDDKKKVDNLITTVRLTVDIVLTVSGIGNLAKLRYLRSLTKLGRAALTGKPVAEGTILASYEFAHGVIGVVEITGSIGNMFIIYSKKAQAYCDVNSSEYDKNKCEFYSKLDNIFTVMQIFGGVLDYATSNLIRNSSKRILEGPIPDDFDPDALGILRRFAGNIDELKDVLELG